MVLADGNVLSGSEDGVKNLLLGQHHRSAKLRPN